VYIYLDQENNCLGVSEWSAKYRKGILTSGIAVGAMTEVYTVDYETLSRQTGK
jgi:hypothetical protein